MATRPERFLFLLSRGVPCDAPLGRTREVIDICRQVWRRERVTYDGKHYQIPLPADRGTGLGKPLQLINHPVRDSIPINIAALGPKNVELTAEIANGWQPVFFLPEKADEVWGDALRAGFAKRDPALGPLDVTVSAPLAEPPSSRSSSTTHRSPLPHCSTSPPSALKMR